MPKYGIVVDSTFKAYPETLEKYNIKEAVLTVTFDDVLQGEVTNAEIMEAIKKGVDVKTSQPTSERFKECYMELFEEGYDEILCLTISLGLSGTFNSANLAIDMLEPEYQDKVHVFDTEQVAMGSLYYLYKAIDYLYDKKLNMVQTIKHLNRLKDFGYIVFVVDDLGTIYRQGRLGKVKYIIGNLLRIKPVLVYKRSELDIASRSARGFKGAFKLMHKRIEETLSANPDKKFTMMIAYVDDYKEARQLKEMVERDFPQIDIRYFDQGSHIIAAHIGPGGIGLYLSAEEIIEGVDE